MSVEGFEIVGADQFHQMVTSMKEKVKGRLDEVGALEEAARLVEGLVRRFKIEAVEAPEGYPPLFRVELSKATVYIVVYPPRYDLLAGDASRVASYILDMVATEGSRKYVVIIFYTRHGKLGPAAYLYLGFLIEEHGVGILFVNGGPEEVIEILEALEREGRYEPPDEEAIPIK